MARNLFPGLNFRRSKTFITLKKRGNITFHTALNACFVNVLQYINNTAYVIYEKFNSEQWSKQKTFPPCKEKSHVMQETSFSVLRVGR